MLRELVMRSDVVYCLWLERDGEPAHAARPGNEPGGGFATNNDTYVPVLSPAFCAAAAAAAAAGALQDGRNWARIEADHHTGALFDVGEAGQWDAAYIGHPQVKQRLRLCHTAIEQMPVSPPLSVAAVSFYVYEYALARTA
jgi:hypothetical protein